jgi:quinol monooxygenase YgiN
MACTVLLELQVQADKVDTLKGVFKDILGDTRAYDGCISVDVTDNQDDGSNMLLIEKWESRAKYEKYLGWREETGALEQLGSLLSAPPSIRYFDPVDA